MKDFLKKLGILKAKEQYDLFLKNEYQLKLEQDGFVVMPYLNDDELQEINTFYKTIHPDEPPRLINGIHMTTWCKDYDYKLKVKEGLEKLFNEAAIRSFKNYRPLNHVFIVKYPGQETTFTIHQDWSVVDENQYPSMNVWVPLQDVDRNNGALWILKGSHKKYKGNIRGAGDLFPDYLPMMEKMKDEIQPIKVKAGEALVFYHSTIHGSPPNLSNNVRIVATHSIIPEQAPLQIYFKKPGSTEIEVHNPDFNFMYEYSDIHTEAAERAPTDKAVKILR